MWRRGRGGPSLGGHAQVISDVDAEALSDDSSNYLFNLGSLEVHDYDHEKFVMDAFRRGAARPARGWWERRARGVDAASLRSAAHAAGTVTRFINHSCEPNCEARDVEIDCSDDRMIHVAFFTQRRIEAGEELTYDYKYQAEEKIRCECGSSNCRTWLR